MAAAVARGGAKGVTVTGHSFMRLLRRAGRDEDSRLRTMNRRRREYAEIQQEIAAEAAGGELEEGAVSGGADRLPALLSTIEGRKRGGNGGGRLVLPMHGGGDPPYPAHHRPQPQPPPPHDPLAAAASSSSSSSSSSYYSSSVWSTEPEGALADNARLASALTKVAAAGRRLRGGRDGAGPAALAQAGRVALPRFRKQLRGALGCRLSGGELAALASHLEQRRFSAVAAATSKSMAKGVPLESARPARHVDGQEFLQLLMNLKIREAASSNGVGVGIDRAASRTSMMMMTISGSGGGGGAGSAGRGAAPHDETSPASASYGRLNGGGGATLSTIRRAAQLQVAGHFLPASLY